MVNKLSNVPEKPGIYIFRDRHKRALYVGKAKALRSRLRSYFQKSSSQDFRKTSMIRRVSDFEYTVTASELEALILEANLIKQHRPRFNILLRDDKNYPYLKLTINEKWPRIEVVRRIHNDRALYFGPYVPASAMWNTLSFIRNNFHIRTCKHSLERKIRPCIQHQIKRCNAPCAGLIGHKEYLNVINEVKLLLQGRNKGLLKLLDKKMQKLSDGMKFEEAAVVRDRIWAIHRISESQKVVSPSIGDVDALGFFRMGNTIIFKILFSRNGIMIGSKDFYLKDTSGETDAYQMKNFIEQFYDKQIIPPHEILCSCLPEDAVILSSWLSQKKGTKVKVSVPRRGIKKKLVEMALENAEILAESRRNAKKETVMRELAVRLNLSPVPQDIGAFDISNISGREAAGSFVYWAEGGFVKDRYRHIKMDEVKGPDDYYMMKEMIRRTFKNAEFGIQNEKVKDERTDQGEMIRIPDLVIIDGGKGQLGAARRAMEEMGIRTEMIGIAKDPDRAFLYKKKYPVSLEDGSASSLLLRRIRDEAHRFAISYHKKLRAKKTLESPLEKIHGVGRKRRFALLKHFGSIDEIKKAAPDEIAALRGFNMRIAQRISESLKRRRNGEK
jgi:excinuclease ABC subunit C